MLDGVSVRPVHSVVPSGKPVIVTSVPSDRCRSSTGGAPLIVPLSTWVSSGSATVSVRLVKPVLPVMLMLRLRPVRSRATPVAKLLPSFATGEDGRLVGGPVGVVAVVPRDRDDAARLLDILDVVAAQHGWRDAPALRESAAGGRDEEIALESARELGGRRQRQGLAPGRPRRSGKRSASYQNPIGRSYTFPARTRPIL